MIGTDAVDGGRRVDWSQTSEDYAKHRPGPPGSLYEKLQSHGVGLPGQRIIDVGTGTGVLAREFAKRGASVTGTDIAEGQIALAQRLAEADGLDIEFRVAPAEASGCDENSFDGMTASQCWIYFDPEKIRTEIQKIVKPGGFLVITHFSFLPLEDPIVAASEAVVLKHNPDWGGAGWHGVTPLLSDIGIEGAHLETYFRYDEGIPFTRESWRGRMRALRGTGAVLDAEALARFDEDHDAMLREMAGESFNILHRIDAHVFRLG